MSPSLPPVLLILTVEEREYLLAATSRMIDGCRGVIEEVSQLTPDGVLAFIGGGGACGRSRRFHAAWAAVVLTVAAAAMIALDAGDDEGAAELLRIHTEVCAAHSCTTPPAHLS